MDTLSVGSISSFIVFFFFILSGWIFKGIIHSTLWKCIRVSWMELWRKTNLTSKRHFNPKIDNHPINAIIKAYKSFTFWLFLKFQKYLIYFLKCILAYYITATLEYATNIEVVCNYIHLPYNDHVNQNVVVESCYATLQWK